MENIFFLSFRNVEGAFLSIPGNPQCDIPVSADENNVVHSPDFKRPSGRELNWGLSLSDQSYFCFRQPGLL